MMRTVVFVEGEPDTVGLHADTESPGEVEVSVNSEAVGRVDVSAIIELAKGDN